MASHDMLTSCRYKDKASIGVHGADPRFKEMGKTFKKEGLLEKAMVVQVLSPVGGFASKL